ncbi:hypothetical protein K2173_026327 [Erythroxylum novogranatense]|uniref:Bet v I/Major latex protein domain-containing protein n=1 Tax=Erythroxylum novogranatense TaxID=1862640 RepID=A0AAV8SMW1_9ROSI|nr:hypothetical protein K2173_026327 [Erythroxylum novogranatense]
MAQIHKHEKVIEIKNSAEDFCKIFSSEAYRLPNVTDKLTSIELVAGDWSSNDSVRSWNYNLNGKAEIFKGRTQVDKANKTLIFTALEGNILRNYKTWKTTLQAAPKNESAGCVKVVQEYEKINEDVPVPHEYMDFIAGFAKEVGDNLSKA